MTKYSIYPVSKFILTSQNNFDLNFLIKSKSNDNKIFCITNKKITGVRLFNNESNIINVELTKKLNTIEFVNFKDKGRNRLSKKYIIVIKDLKIISFIYKIFKIIFSLKNTFENPCNFITFKNSKNQIFRGRISKFNAKSKYILSCGKNYTEIKLSKNGFFATNLKLGNGIKIIKINELNSKNNILIDFIVTYMQKNFIDSCYPEENDYLKLDNSFHYSTENNYQLPSKSKALNLFIDGIDFDYDEIKYFLIQFNKIDMSNIFVFFITDNLLIKKNIFSFNIHYIYEKKSFSSAVNRNLNRLQYGFTIFLSTYLEFPKHLFHILLSEIKNNMKLVYFDEYKPSTTAKYQFKPAFDRIYLLSKNYIGTNFCISNELLKKHTFNLESGICPFYDLLLKISRDLKDSQVLHLPLILKNKFKSPIPKVIETNTLKSFRTNRLQWKSRFGSYCLLPPVITTNNSVSLIITTAGDVSLLNKLLVSIQNKTQKINYDIIIVTHTTNFGDSYKSNYFNEISSNLVRVIKHEISPFNYSSIINFAVSFSKSTYICLLNDDMEILNGNWLTELLRWFSFKDTGVVGSLLLYPDNKIQHAGIALGLNYNCDHPEKGFSRFRNEVLSHINNARSVTAVTGACLLIKKETFISSGGMNPLFAEAFNDVDLCLRIRKKGYNIVITPHSTIRHYESVSVGPPLSDSRRLTFRNEINLFLKLHQRSIDKESFYSTNFSLTPKYYQLANPPRNNFHFRPLQNKKSSKEKPKHIWKNNNINTKEQICVFSHYDVKNEIQDHVIYYLNELNKLNFSIFFVSSCPHLKLTERSKINKITSAIICSNGNGRDWGNYAMGYNYSLGITKVKNILFTNDSIWGPITSLKPFFNFAEKSSTEILGLTDSYQTEYHIQSYFIYCKESVCNSKIFEYYFEKFIPQINKQDIIQQNEIGFSRLFRNSGYQLDAFFRYSDIKKSTIAKKAFGHELVQKGILLNSTHHFSKLMIEDLEFPFIKIELVKVNPSKVPDIRSIILSVKCKNYDLFKILQSEFVKLLPINQ
jgi:GT2 family glycosyltransferase